ncbi:hypothetical protein BG000_007886 [Podila horticola]|nr:hypothetical protein BG000_007886 [Podila horticola]
MNSNRRNSKQISPEDGSSMQPRFPETKIKLKFKQPDPGNLSENDIKKVFVAIEENDVKTMKYYLSQRHFNPDNLYDTNIFEESTFTWSALHAAAYYGAMDVIGILMEYNANVELQDTWYKGRPLAWAAFGGKYIFCHLEAAKLLIEKYSADKRAQNEHGQVALELVYEKTPEWEKMFAETKPAKSNDRGLKPRRDRDREGKSGKDSKELKFTGSASPVVLAAAFQELYKLILNHKDKTGRDLADIFLALPSKEEYPEYYEVIKSPMSLQLVQGRIKAGHYKNVDDFDREFQLIFENALIFNEDGSRINKDARVLLKLFNTRKKDVYAHHKLVEKVKSSGLDKMDRRQVSSLTKGGVNYQAGEFVELNDSPRTILLVERLEMDSNNHGFIAGSKFLRPEQTLQVPGQTFYEKEVLKASGEWEFDFDLVDHKIYVQAHKDFVRGQVIEFDKKDVYVCENRYSETGKSAFLIKDWKRVYTVDPLATPVRPYPATLKLPKFEVKSLVNKGMVMENAGKFNGRRSSSFSHSDTSKKGKRPRKEGKKPKSAKRGRSEESDDDDDDAEDEDVDVDGFPAPMSNSQRRRSSQLKQQQQQQKQLQLQQQQHQHQQHQQQHQQQFMQQQQYQQQHLFNPQIQPMPQGYPQHPQFNQHPHPLQQQPRERRVSNNPAQNPALFQQQQQQMLQQQQQQQMMFQQQQMQQQQMMFQQQMMPQQGMPQGMSQQGPPPPPPPPTSVPVPAPMPVPQQMSNPQSPNGSRAAASPGSPNRPPQSLIPVSNQPFAPVEMSTVFDPHVGPRRGYAMLQSIAMDSEDKSFVMSLGTDTFSHSLAVHNQVQSMTMIPLLAFQLSPIQPQIGISVFQNGRKLTPSGLVALPNSPTIGHHVYTIALIPGQNTIDVWVSAQVGGLFQGGPPGGKTETQQYFIFVQRNAM